MLRVHETKLPFPAPRRWRRKPYFRNSSPHSQKRLAERDGLLFVMRKEITLVRDEVRSQKNHPPYPDVKPSSMSASAKAASPKWERPSMLDCGVKRHNPKIARRDVVVKADAMPEGALRNGCEVHTVRDIVFRIEQTRHLREVWRLPDDSRLVAQMPPGVDASKEQYWSGLKTFVVSLCHYRRSTVRCITTLLNDIWLLKFPVALKGESTHGS